MHAFVTGSTGMLGGNIVKLLLEQGHTVKALARSPEKARQMLGNLDVEIVIGDMTDVTGFAAAMQGCDVLFHTAAYFRESYTLGEHWEQLKHINVDGTINILNAAEQQGIQRVIYISSSGVIGKAPEGQYADESFGPDDYTMKNPYFKSKVLAEDAIAEWSKQHDLGIVQILPGWIFGPGDAGPTAAGQIILDFLKKSFPGTVDIGADVVDARDVAQASINAVARGRSGERYIVAGPYANQRDLFNAMERVSGIPAPKRHLPYPIAVLFIYFQQNIANLLGRKTAATVSGLQTLRARKRNTSQKAIRELGIQFRPLDETMRDTMLWYLNNMPDQVPTEIPRLKRSAQAV